MLRALARANFGVCRTALKTPPILSQLEDAGFIDPVKLGKYARKAEERLASEYRLTDFSAT